MRWGECGDELPPDAARNLGNIMAGQFARQNTKSSKLSISQVMEIKEKYEHGWTQGQLCHEYDVSIGQIGRIVRGESWRSVGVKALSPLEVQASEARVLARLEEERRDPRLAELAAEFRAMEMQTPVVRTPPPSLLEGGDAPDEAPGALNELQQRAKAFGLDIEQAGGLK